MTQIVAAGNWTYAAVVAERRFTVDGVLVDSAAGRFHPSSQLAHPHTKSMPKGPGVRGTAHVMW